MERRYFFKTSAVGAGARLDRIGSKKCEQPIPAIAVSALPASGGRSESKKDHFCFDLDAGRRGVLAVREAETNSLACVDPKNGATSESNAVVRGFSVLGKVTADLLEAHLQTTIGPSEKFPRIRPRGTRIEGLKVDGFAVKVTLDEKLFSDCADMESVANRYGKDKDLQNKFFWRFNAEKGAAQIPEVRGSYVCSLVKEMKWAGKPHPDVTIDGYKLIWRGFGVIYVGEIFVGQKSRQLTLVRVEMGEQTEVAAAAGSAKPKKMALAAENGPDNFGSASGGSVEDGVGTMP